MGDRSLEREAESISNKGNQYHCLHLFPPFYQHYRPMILPTEGR